MIPDYLMWDRSKTCSILAGRAIFVLGDSMSGQFYDTLVSALQPSNASYADRASSTIVCSSEGEAPSLVQYINVEEKGFAAVQSASVKIGSKNPIFVLNRGLWYRPLSSHLAAVRTLVDSVTSLDPNATLFWRTSVAGHADAFGAKLLQNAPPLVTPLTVDAYTSGLPLQYHWWEIQSQHEETLKVLPLNVIVLDVVNATNLRHDSHPKRSFAIDKESRDGLHYCIPGPVDMWVELWAAALRYSASVSACLEIKHSRRYLKQ